MTQEYKNYRIVGDGTFGMYVIKSIGPGAIPDILQGSFSKTVNAKQAIDTYSLQKEERDSRPAPIKKIKLTPREEKVDATTEGPSGD